MKITHITTVHHPFDNRIFNKECVSLAEKGYEVVLIATHGQDEVIKGVQIRSLKKPKSRISRIFFTTFNAYKLALNEDADIFHFHDPELIPAAWLMVIRGKKVVYDVHEDYVASIKQKNYLPRPISILIASLFGIFEKLLSKSFYIVLAEKYYRKRFPVGHCILNYPRKMLVSSLTGQVQSRKLQVLYTGNITRDRGAFQHARVVDYLDDIAVYLVGFCSKFLVDELFAMVKGKDRLHIIGIDRFVPFDEIVSYYNRGNWTAGLALFPSTPHYVNKELTKFFEYMAAGIPILCSEFTVWKKIIEETELGLTTDPDDGDAIAKNIIYLYNNKDKAKQMGIYGKEKVVSEFNWEKEADKLEQLYKDILSDEVL